MQPETLSDKIDRLTDLREERNVVDKVLEEKKIEYEKQIESIVETRAKIQAEMYRLQADILLEMNRARQETAGTHRATVSKKVSKTYEVTDPMAFVHSLDALKIKDHIFDVSLTEKFKEYASESKIQGVAPKYKEYLSVRTKK